MTHRFTPALNSSIVLILGVVAGCSGGETFPNLNTGGAPPTGGVVGSGGTLATGGSTPATGGTPVATGGSTTGGAASFGGAKASGGSTSSGGSGLASGGTATGGSKSGGGGGKSTTGGAAAGGAATGGTAAGGTGGASKSAGCGVTDYPKSGKATIDVGGTQREYILKLPSNYDANNAYKLVFGWHWRGGNAENVANGGSAYYGLEKLANGTAIFVSPNGIDNGWANTNGRDITFLKAMLAFFNSKLCIDQKRIFSTGFSFGGMMSNAVGLDMADVFRAIAPMSGAIYSGGNRSSTKPIAVWMSHGDADNVVPIADGEAALKIFVKNNGCGTETAAVSPSPCVAYQGCTSGYPVTYCKFSGGHNSPNFAGAAIWEFFSQF